MAGDWIKMRSNLWDDPRVAKICDLTDEPEASVVGGLYWLWASADQHTEDGIMVGLSVRQIDRKTGIQGFGAALCAVGWMKEIDDGVQIVRFEEHNGASAKRRASESRRKMSARDADESRTESVKVADEPQPPSGSFAHLEKEKEKEKEKKPNTRSSASFAKPDDVSESVWADFLSLRKTKRAPVTETAIAAVRREADKAGVTLQDALTICCAKGWQGFNADWIKPADLPTAAAPKPDWMAGVI